MITTDYFIQPQNNILKEENLQIVLYLWKEGKFQSDLQELLNLDSPKSIDLLIEQLHSIGLLEIDKNKKNISTSAFEPYYFITTENIRSIFMHICEFANAPYDDNILEVILKDRKNFNLELIKKIMNDFIQNNELKDRILKILMKRMISFFFLFIIEQGPTFKNNTECCNFANNLVLETLLTDSKQLQKSSTKTSTSEIKIEEKVEDAVKKDLENEKEIMRPWAKGV